MTNQEYIQKSLGLFGIASDTIDIILVDSGLNGNGLVDILECKRAILKDFHHVRTAAHRNVSEGGFSLSWNDCEKALKSFEKDLSNDVGDTEDTGGYGCVDKSYVW